MEYCDIPFAVEESRFRGWAKVIWWWDIIRPLLLVVGKMKPPTTSLILLFLSGWFLFFHTDRKGVTSVVGKRWRKRAGVELRSLERRFASLLCCFVSARENPYNRYSPLLRRHRTPDCIKTAQCRASIDRATRFAGHYFA